MERGCSRRIGSRVKKYTREYIPNNARYSQETPKTVIQLLIIVDCQNNGSIQILYSLHTPSQQWHRSIDIVWLNFSIIFSYSLPGSVRNNNNWTVPTKCVNMKDLLIPIWIWVMTEKNDSNIFKTDAVSLKWIPEFLIVWVVVVVDEFVDPKNVKSFWWNLWHPSTFVCISGFLLNYSSIKTIDSLRYE